MYCILCGAKIRKGELAYKTIENSKDEWICDGCITEHRVVDDVDIQRVKSQEEPIVEGVVCPTFGTIVTDNCKGCAYHSRGFTYNPLTNECEHTKSK